MSPHTHTKKNFVTTCMYAVAYSTCILISFRNQTNVGMAGYAVLVASLQTGDSITHWQSSIKKNTVCHWTNVFVHCELLVQRFTLIKSRFSISQHHKFKQALQQSLLHVNMYVCVHALVSSMPLQQQCFHDNNVSTCTYKITIEMKGFAWLITVTCTANNDFNCTNT